MWRRREKLRVYALLMKVTRHDTVLNRAPTYSLLLASHGGTELSLHHMVKQSSHIFSFPCVTWWNYFMYAYCVCCVVCVCACVCTFVVWYACDINGECAISLVSSQYV